MLAGGPIPPAVDIDFTRFVAVTTGPGHSHSIAPFVDSNVMTKTNQSVLSFVLFGNGSNQFFAHELPRRFGVIHDYLAQPIVMAIASLVVGSRSSMNDNAND